MVKRMIDEKHERHDLAFEKFQRARDDGNEDITKRFLFLGILNKWQMADKKNATVKYRRTHSPFVEIFKKELWKQLFRSVDTQKLEKPEKVSAIGLKIWIAL